MRSGSISSSSRSNRLAQSKSRGAIIGWHAGREGRPKGFISIIIIIIIAIIKRFLHGDRRFDVIGVIGGVVWRTVAAAVAAATATDVSVGPEGANLLHERRQALERDQLGELRHANLEGAQIDEGEVETGEELRGGPLATRTDATANVAPHEDEVGAPRRLNDWAQLIRDGVVREELDG